jgi:hypothetical protein
MYLAQVLVIKRPVRVHGVIPVECYRLEKMNFKQYCNKQLIEEKESYSETCLNGTLNKPEY